MISVIITAYNVGPYIEEAVRSVLNQTYKDLECIVVLDKPTDNTEVVVMKIAKEDSRVRVLKNPQNVGAGLSRRNGLQNARGEYTLLLDGDDFLTPSFIEDLYKKAIETGSDIVSGGITIRRENGDEVINYGECITEGNDKIAKFWGENIVFMNNKLIHNHLHKLVPYCHRRYIEDTPVIIPQLWYANRVAYVDNPGYIYRMRDTSLTHSSNLFKDVVFKGLCWCDLMEFFIQRDTSVFEAIDIPGYIRNTFTVINQQKFGPEDLQQYPMEWAEFTMRLFRLINVTNITYSIPSQPVNTKLNLDKYSYMPTPNRLIDIDGQTAFYDISKCARTSLCMLAYKEHTGNTVDIDYNTMHKYTDPFERYYLPVDSKINKKVAVWRDPVERALSFYNDKILNSNDFFWYYGVKGLHTNSTIDEFIQFLRIELRKAPELQDQHVREQCNCYDIDQVDEIVKIQDLDKYLESHGFECLHDNAHERQNFNITEEQKDIIRGLYIHDYDILNNRKIWRV